MSTAVGFYANSVSEAIINFLASLQGMDRFHATTELAAIDLSSGVVIRPDPDFPGGEMLQVQFVPNDVSSSVAVHTYKLVDTFLVRHARMLEVSEGGRVDQHYDHIVEHFSRKTGFGLE